ncbi:hypothetical protein NQ315_001413 [Exocentrus adspersus]|uniref:Fibronectin type-III domain-containing protein n=1 Tax=Exocentrus adspersus TaxID=1586481 RepID=A0AAV8WFU3_9CUCU|nr:hypothetical protein NQ315_001413 [Exocentrus adspersus]
MMSTKFILIFGVWLCLVDVAKGEECVAGYVLNLRIHVGGNLTWTVSPAEPCRIEAFQVDVVGDRQDEYHFTVTTTYADLSYLKACEEWQFLVTPISNGVLGRQMRIVDWIPLPEDADLTLRYFNVTEVGKKDILLEWDLRNRTHGDCTLEYRVVVTDRQSSSSRDVYFTGHFARLDFLSPCVPYRLTIRAVNMGNGGVEGPLLASDVEIPAYPEDPPKLKDLQVGPTSLSTIWQLENYVTNRCPVTNLFLDGGTYFNITIPIRDPFGRPPVQVNVTNLLPNTMYVFRTRVENIGGLSTVVPMAVQTLELAPGPVLNLKIHPNATLTWSLNPSEPCEVNSFQVAAEGDREDDYHVRVSTNYVDLSMLKTCEQWKFYVTPISQNILGHSTRLIDWIPLPENANLTLDYFYVFMWQPGDIYAMWGLANRTYGDCTLQYRISILDQDTAFVRDIYVTGTSIALRFLSPCIHYHFSIRAVNTALNGIEGKIATATYQVPPYPEDPPTLRHIDIGPTYISMFWRLENYLKNRCPVLLFYLDGGEHFNHTIPVMDTDGRPPVHVNVTGLQPNTRYSFKVYVKNTGGMSPAVPMVVQTSELNPTAE